MHDRLGWACKKSACKDGLRELQENDQVLVTKMMMSPKLISLLITALMVLVIEHLEINGAISQQWLGSTEQQDN